MIKPSILCFFCLFIGSQLTFSQGTKAKEKPASQKDVIKISAEAISKFNLKINSKRVVCAIRPNQMKITVAPVLEDSTSKDKWRNIAVTIIASVNGKGEKYVLPFGTYKLQFNGTTSRMVDEKGKTYNEGETQTTNTNNLRIGWVGIDWLDVSRFCYIWDGAGGVRHYKCVLRR